MISALLLAAALAVDVPDEVRPFIEKDTAVLAIERGDLDRDGDGDYVLVLEPEDREQPRPLLVLLRRSNGPLELAKRSAKAVFCRNCGGVMGDPFQGVVVEKGRLTVEHYGGSSWRWTWKFAFAWSRRDQSWQLVRVESTSFHASDPDGEEKTVHTPPRDFGLIDVSEFDPDDYLGRGKK